MQSMSDELFLQFSRVISDIQNAKGRFWMRGRGQLIRVESVDANGIALCYESDEDFQDLLPFKVFIGSLLKTYVRTARPSELAALARTMAFRPRESDAEKLSCGEVFSPVDLSSAEKASLERIGHFLLDRSVNRKDQLTVLFDGYINQLSGDIVADAWRSDMEALTLGYAIMGNLMLVSPFRLALQIEVIRGQRVLIFYRAVQSYRTNTPTLEFVLQKFKGDLF